MTDELDGLFWVKSGSALVTLKNWHLSAGSLPKQKIAGESYFRTMCSRPIRELTASKRTMMPAKEHEICQRCLEVYREMMRNG